MTGQITHISPIDLDDIDRVSSGYGNRIHPTRGIEHFHIGVDIAAASGVSVKATAAGMVIWKGEQNIGFGKSIIIKHSDGTSTRYSHLESFADIRVNQEVSQGTHLGGVGSTGTGTGNHLDYGVYTAAATQQIVDEGNGGALQMVNGVYKVSIGVGRTLFGTDIISTIDPTGFLMQAEVNFDGVVVSSEVGEDTTPSDIINGNLTGSLGDAIASSSTVTVENVNESGEV